MKHLKLYEDYNTENEGLKTWGAGIMAGLSLFANSVIAGDLKVNGTGKSQDMSIAIKKAQSNARLQAIKQIGGDGSNSANIKNGQFGYPKITLDKDGNYIVTIDYSVDSSDVNVKKKIPSQIMSGDEAKLFLKDILKMGFVEDRDIDEFIGTYSDKYNFKISKMSQEQASNVGDISIKLTKVFKGGTIVYCVVTPIQ